MMRPMSKRDIQERLEGLLEAFQGQHIAVLGDLALDEFVHGRTLRVSREAPVLILRHEGTSSLPGCAGNAARNVAALGGGVEALGVLGDDAAGDTLLEALKACHIETTSIQRLPGGQTWCKTRFTAGDLHTVQQQVMRLDREPRYPRESQWRRTLEAQIEARLQHATGVLLCDYGGGLFDAETRRLVLEHCRQRNLPVVADSRYALQDFRGITCATPNETEIEPLLGRNLDDDDAVVEAGKELQTLLQCPSLIITRGRLGMTVFDDAEPWHLPAFGADAVDVAGAGDTVSATVILALAAGGSVRDAARLANYAASQVVQQRGTAVTSRDQVLSCLHRDASLR